MITIDPTDLSDMFAPLLQLYEPTQAGVHYDHHDSDAWDHGEPLGQLINSEWDVFSDRLLSADPKEPDPLHRLVEDIFSPLFDYKEQPDFGPAAPWSDKEQSLFSTPLEQGWSYFKYHIKYSQRFATGEIPPELSEITRLLSDPLLEELSRTLPISTRLYRARVGSSMRGRGPARPLARKELQAPPRDKARAGRASPEGIPVLYTANEPETAIAECRPWKGALVSVGSVTLKRDAKIVDLAREADLKEAPFGSEELEWQLRRERTLRLIGRELATPVGPDQSSVDYVPTQYVSEAIREAGYDGIAYKSALAKGVNIVLFDPSIATVAKSKRLYRVNDVEWTIEADPVVHGQAS